MVVCGDDEVTEVGGGYLGGQVIEVSRWNDGGFGADDCFYPLQQEVIAEIVEVEVHF